MNPREKLQEHVLGARAAMFEADLAIVQGDHVAAMKHLEQAIDHANEAWEFAKLLALPPAK